MISVQSGNDNKPTQVSKADIIVKMQKIVENFDFEQKYNKEDYKEGNQYQFMSRDDLYGGAIASSIRIRKVEER